ncbi:MAG: hypothetical protein ACHP6H_00750, partial [Legionellales bacterium]
MTITYDVTAFYLGEPSMSGHEVYLNARDLSNEEPDKQVHVILKKNKHGRVLASSLEVAFSQIMRLFLAPGLTPTQHLVVDSSKTIWGMAVEHMCYVIAKKEGISASFYTLEQPEQCRVELKKVSQAEEIPFYFLNALPQGFFARLIKPENGLSLDYESLANIMATSYTLEEDDLHKGNFGFYILKSDTKKLVRFFKIDHDLMFIDSIMSFCSARFFHWGQSEHAFDITEKDVLDFPNLKDSANSYWPTRKSRLIHPFNQDKEYRTEEEVQAFASLSQHPDFIKAKWTAFYKHILLSEASIHESLSVCFDETDPYQRAQRSLILHATLLRQARLRAVLFSIKAFREFVSDMPVMDKASLLEIVSQSDATAKEALHQKMEGYSQGYYDFQEGDTPLHTAIRLGEYRCDETLQMFGAYLNTANARGNKPLDLALLMASKQGRNTANAQLAVAHIVQSGVED